MSTTRVRTRAALALLAGLTLGACGRGHEETADGGGGPAARMEQPADGGATRITLADGVAVRMGLQVAAVEAAQTSGEREAYGRVLDVVPLSELVAARETARAALEQARSEYDRVLALHRLDQNTSKREVEAALLALRRAEVDLAGAQERLRAAWGDTLARRDDLPALVGRMAERNAALARVEVPPGQAADGMPTLASLALATSSAPVASATLLAPAPTTDPLTQGRGFLLLLGDAPPPPGSALVAQLRFADEVRAQVLLPRGSVVWKDGEAFVYVQEGPDTFARHPVTLAPDEGAGWLAAGIEPATKVAVVGAQELLSQEILAGAGAE